MAKVILSSGSGSERSWKTGDKFTAKLFNDREEDVKGEKARIVTFLDSKGEMIERWSTTLWDRLLDGDKVRKVKPMLKLGDVVEVEVLEEQKMKGGKRFRPFVVAVLTGKEIPKGCR